MFRALMVSVPCGWRPNRKHDEDEELPQEIATAVFGYVMSVQDTRDLAGITAPQNWRCATAK